jgi:hypothetical protein
MHSKFLSLLALLQKRRQYSTVLSETRFFTIAAEMKFASHSGRKTKGYTELIERSARLSAY